MNPETIIKDIASLKIQGAENIAKAGVNLIKSSVGKYDIQKLLEIKKKLIDARPTEPCLRNSLSFVFRNNPEKAEILRRCNYVLEHFSSSDLKIAEIASKKISNNMIIFTHCHSSTVMNVLKYAKEVQKKKFSVFCSETRPRFQGRKTAEELIKLGIPTTLFIDSAFRIALKKCDLCLIGADAITVEGKIVNKIGSELISLICNHYDIPMYSCTNSWKFDPKSIFGYEEEIEMRSPKEIWDNPPKGLKICNYAFEKVNPDMLSGVITEIGIYKTTVFVEELRHHYPWMFDEE